MNPKVQLFEIDFAEGAEELQTICFPFPFPTEDLFKADHYRYNSRTFPEGQFMIIFDDKLVATSSNLIVSEKAWANLTTWKNLVGGLEIKNHDPNGTTLFGVDISVHPSFRNQGLARLIYDARIKLSQRLGLSRFTTACRLPGLSRKPNESPLTFVNKIVEGEEWDLPLSAFLRLGMNFTGVKEEFMPDPESRNCCAILERRLS